MTSPCLRYVDRLRAPISPCSWSYYSVCVNKMLSLKLEYHKAGVAGVEAGLASKFEPEAASGLKA